MTCNILKFNFDKGVQIIEIVQTLITTEEEVTQFAYWGWIL